MFDAPRHARGFLEALIVDNLDLGRPHNVEIIFGRRVRRDTLGTFRTAIDRRDNGGVLLNVFYRHSRIKQYLKDGRAMRIETVINHTRDLGCNARLPNLDDLQTKARACNRRILNAQRVGQGCVLASPAFERIAHPTVDAAGCRTPALRFGDPRVMALTGALYQTLLAATARERFAALADLSPSLSVSRMITADADEANAYFASMVASGHEGVMAKALESPSTTVPNSP